MKLTHDHRCQNCSQPTEVLVDYENGWDWWLVCESCVQALKDAASDRAAEDRETERADHHRRYLSALTRATHNPRKARNP